LDPLDPCGTVDTGDARDLIQPLGGVSRVRQSFGTRGTRLLARKEGVDPPINRLFALSGIITHANFSTATQNASNSASDAFARSG
jgi:hypothetical protein